MWIRLAAFRSILIASALSAPAPAEAQPSHVPRPATNARGEPPARLRLGVDGHLQSGPVVAMIASIRLETPVSSRGAVSYRVGALSGALLYADPEAAYEGGLVHVGYRRYRSGGYLGIEGGVVVVRESDYVDFEARRRGNFLPLPNSAVSVGLKAGPIDLGLTAMFPLVSIGLHMGIDFVSW